MAGENEETAQSDPGNDDNLLFSGLAIHLTALCPQKEHFRNLIEVNGGAVYKTEVNAHIIISDHLRSKGNDGRAVSYKWIEASIEARELVDIDEYLISKYQSKMPAKSSAKPKQTAAGIKRQVEATGPAPKRPGRNLFTKEDDYLLLWWIEKAEYPSGNAIYQELTNLFPHHTFHSWRERWVKVLSKYPKQDLVIPADFDVTKTLGWHDGIVRPGSPHQKSQRRPKQQQQQRAQQVQQEVDDVIEDMEEEPKDAAIAPEHEAALKERIPELIATEDQSTIDNIFSELASENPGCTAEEFKNFFGACLERYQKEQEKIRKKRREEKKAKAAAEAKAARERLSQLEQRALFAKLDDLVLADDLDEMLEICQELSEEYEHTAQDFVNYFQKKMKPAVKRIKKKGKLSVDELENAVIKALAIDENGVSETEISVRTPVHASKVQPKLASKEQDVRYEPLANAETPKRKEVARPDNSSSAGGANAPGTNKSREPTSSRTYGRDGAVNADTTPTPAQPVMVYSPKGSRGHPTPHKSPSPFVAGTPGTGRSARSTASDKATLLVAKKTSPDSPAPRSEGIQVVDLTDVNDEPSVLNAAQSFIASTKEFLDASTTSGENGITSSPPQRNIAVSAKEKLPIPAPLGSPVSLRPRSSPPLTSELSSYGPESDGIPFRPVTTLPASSVQKISRRISTSSSKRRRTSRSDQSELVVESTPDAKLFPVKQLDNLTPSPTASQQLQREAYSSDIASSPLASRSLKRKKFEHFGGDSQNLVDDDLRTIEEDGEGEDEDTIMAAELDSNSDEGDEDTAESPLFYVEDSSEDEPLVPSDIQLDRNMTDGDDDDNRDPKFTASDEEQDPVIIDDRKIEDFMEEVCRKYGFESDIVATIIEVTCDDRKLVITICDLIQQHLDSGGDLSGMTVFRA
ncbi:hypothetical protein ABW19_dt0200974 [Dactylella cylindrospora]|nr:hypothetical protein ABW19_dt0200974 [Dactylella cylindrospora]